MTRTLVVVPTYDEAENLEATVAAVLEAVPDADVLVVDDASPDGTGAIADRLAAADARVSVLHRAAKTGLGRAYLDAFAIGLDRGYEVLVEIDADGSHPAAALPTLLGALDADPAVGLAIGSRWIQGGSVVGWPRHRRALSVAGNWYARTLLRLKVRDVTAGYRAYRAAVLAEIDEGVASRGYAFQIDMTVRAVDAGWAVVEVPIVFRERTAGHSKMTTGIVVEAMLRVTGWGVRRLSG